VTSSSLDTLAFTCSKTQSVSGSSVTWRVDVSSGGISHALVPAYTETTDATDTQIKKEVEATVQPITITFRYRLIVEGATEIDLTTVVNPGTLSARGVYGPPPAAG